MNLSRTNWRASLVPAAAVIPAPIAYTKVVAVKKLVVGFRDAVIFFPWCEAGGDARHCSLCFLCALPGMHLFFPDTFVCLFCLHSFAGAACICPFFGAGYLGLYFEKIRVFKAGAFFA